MRIILSLVFIVCIIGACQKKSLPVIENRTYQPAYPKADTLTAAPDMAAGQVLFTNRCGKCHGLPETGKYSVNRWETIMLSMAPKAKLTRQQHADVLAYVKQDAIK